MPFVSAPTTSTLTDYLHISVAYVGRSTQVLRQLESRSGIDVREAIEQSGLLQQFPEIDLDINKVGIFGKVVKLDHVLNDADRVEIYRPLIADPKQARKRRASESAKPNTERPAP